MDCLSLNFQGSNPLQHNYREEQLMSKHRHYDICKSRKWKTLVFGHALCFGGKEGGSRGGWGGRPTQVPGFYVQGWSCMHSLKVSDLEAVEAGVGGRDREQMPF